MMHPYLFVPVLCFTLLFTTRAHSQDTSYRPDIFSVAEVEGMKQFFLHNTAKPEQPKGSSWNNHYRHKCINTVRAGLEILLFGQSAIPDSLYSTRPLFNGDFQSNDVQTLAARMTDSNYLYPPDTLWFNALNRHEWVKIARDDPATRYLRPMELQGSLWYTLLAKIGAVKGYSVFVVSLCDGYHSAILTVDHRNLAQVLVYWSDQTHKHPYRYLLDDRLIEVKNGYGWELMQQDGPATTTSVTARGLDAYIQYAMEKYWCDCGLENQSPEDCCAGHCFPALVIWRVKRPYRMNGTTH